MTNIRELWRLMKSILRSARQIVHSELGALNLTGAEGDILFHLLFENDGLSQEMLAERLDIGKAAVSRTVHSLAEKGYVHRKRRLDDARAYHVTLTKAAIGAGARIEHAYSAVYEAALREIADLDIQHVAALLEKVNENLHAQEVQIK